jgi:putative PIN family toxin of toxin-antitoxin system
MVPKPRLRVFLDASVIFSALYSPKGAPGAILKASIVGNIGVVISQQVLDEVVRTIKLKLPAALPLLKDLLLSLPPEIVSDPPYTEVKRWTDRLQFADGAILAAAISAGVDYFITGDSHFLSDPFIASESCLRIVTPAQFMNTSPIVPS